ncbi:MAG: Hsp20/alpha crystallin family protein [Chitinophagales bacterium]|nr:Hsp20/alpha crystallin family protein [Chitinophagales bacterium]
MLLVNQKNSKPKFNSLFDEFFNTGDYPTAFGGNIMKTPAVNVIETNDSYKIQVSAPGFKKENLNIQVEENLLTISGELKTENKEEGEKYTRKEFSSSSFSRSFTVPETVIAEKIEGKYEDGILNIVLPKLEEVKGISKKIEIS